MRSTTRRRWAPIHNMFKFSKHAFFIAAGCDVVLLCRWGWGWGWDRGGWDAGPHTGYMVFSAVANIQCGILPLPCLPCVWPPGFTTDDTVDVVLAGVGWNKSSSSPSLRWCGFVTAMFLLPPSSSSSSWSGGLDYIIRYLLLSLRGRPRELKWWFS